MKINKIVLGVKDLDESIRFYQEAFGFQLLKKIDTGMGQNAALQCGDLFLTLMVSPKLPVGILSLGTHSDGDIRASYEELLSKGAQPVMEPTQVGLGVLAKCFDPNGISLQIMDEDLNGSDSGQRLTHLPHKVKGE